MLKCVRYSLNSQETDKHCQGWSLTLRPKPPDFLPDYILIYKKRSLQELAPHGTVAWIF